VVKNEDLLFFLFDEEDKLNNNEDLLFLFSVRRRMVEVYDNAFILLCAGDERSEETAVFAVYVRSPSIETPYINTY